MKTYTKRQKTHYLDFYSNKMCKDFDNAYKPYFRPDNLKLIKSSNEYEVCQILKYAWKNPRFYSIKRSC